MNSSELVTAVTALAVALAQGKTAREITRLSVLFTQIGDTLATISFQQSQKESGHSPGPLRDPIGF